MPVAGSTGSSQAKIFVPAPATTTLLARNILKVEDYGTSVYVFYNGNPYIRIELGGKVATHYTSGTVYDVNMNVVGVFSGMAIESLGKAGIVQRDAQLRLYSAEIKIKDLGTNVNNISYKFNTYQSGSLIVVDLTGLNGVQNVSVCDIQGKSMFSRIANGGQKITISNTLKTGVYLVKVQGSEKSIMTKMIIR